MEFNFQQFGKTEKRSYSIRESLRVIEMFLLEKKGVQVKIKAPIGDKQIQLFNKACTVAFAHFNI